MSEPKRLSHEELDEILRHQVGTDAAAKVRGHLIALNQEAIEDAAALHGHSVFVGPCVHGRDPWDRCDECGEETAIHALLKVRTALEQQAKATGEALNRFGTHRPGCKTKKHPGCKCGLDDALRAAGYQP